MIYLKNISKLYEMGDMEVRAVDDITLHIAPQEFVAIVGPSGSGKSTLMNIMGCLDIPDMGEYILDGEEVSSFSENELSAIRSQKIGFIFQQFNLLEKLTAYGNVELPLIYQRTPGSERKRRVMEALATVGLTERMNHKPSQLSGGQQQKVAIARALVTHPSIILADEPTGNLDSKSGEDVMNVIKNLSGQGNTIVMITHNEKLANLAGRKIHISDGRVAENGEVV